MSFPSQIGVLFPAVTLGIGEIVIVKVIGVPIQVPTEGVAVIVPEIAVLPEFVPVKVGIFPVPDAPKPIAAFELVQSTVEIAGFATKLTAVEFVFAQKV